MYNYIQKKNNEKIMNLKKEQGLITATKSKETRAANTNPSKIYKI